MHPSDLGSDVALFDVLDVRFDEVPGPALSVEVLSAVDSAWDEMVRANPTLFDGPVVLCSDVRQMSSSTSSPGAIQFPGGNLEPPPLGQKITTSALRRHAAVELVEETGIDADPDDLVLWIVARTSNRNVGFFFLAPSLPVEVILQRHAAVVLAERLTGRESEFAEVALVTDAAGLAVLDGRPADYLWPLLDRFRATGHSL